jgi:molybdopterin converting factor small subunit
MTVLVRLPHSLAVDAGGQVELAFELAPNASLADLLDQVQARYPALERRLRDETGAVRRFVNVYVGEEESRVLHGLQTPVPSDALVLVAGSVAGG